MTSTASFLSAGEILKQDKPGMRIRYPFLLALNTALEALYLDPKDCRMIARQTFFRLWN
jgi:hypothetical protein